MHVKRSYWLAKFSFGCVLSAVFSTAIAQPLTDTDCQCRDSSGSMQNLGTVVCINITGTDYLVRCEMSQNTPYWNRVTDESGCPLASNKSALETLLKI